MANTSSAKKAIRVSERKRKINLKIKDGMKASRKAVRKAIEAKDTKLAKELLVKTYKQIDKAASKNVIHKKTAARYKSRLAKAIEVKP